MRRRGGFEVCVERCDQCLFGRDKIVSDARRREILRILERDDSHFVCHKFSIAEGEGANVCCRGDYDRNPHRTNPMRIATSLGVVKFVPLPEREAEA